MKRTIFAAGAVVLAVASSPVYAEGSPALQETVTPVFEREIPSIPGKSLIALEVVYQPGGASPSHRHAQSAFIYAYVLSGEIVSAVDDETPHVYRAGESWFEEPGAHHRVSRNASETEPAKLLAIFVVDRGERQLVLPDPD